MSNAPKQFEEMLTAMAAALMVEGFREPRLTAAVALSGLLNAGFTPIRSIADLEAS